MSVGQWVGSGHITKYQINLDLIEIIQFCLNIYDFFYILDIFLDILLKPPQPLIGLFLQFLIHVTWEVVLSLINLSNVTSLSVTSVCWTAGLKRLLLSHTLSSIVTLEIN